MCTVNKKTKKNIKISSHLCDKIPRVKNVPSEVENKWIENFFK